MKLLQIKVDDKLKKAIEEKSELYGVPASSLIKIVLVKTFIEEKKQPFKPGNVFNADRDNKGVGLKLDDIIALL